MSMPQDPAAGSPVPPSTIGSERSSASTKPSDVLKLRSCTVCRNRRVRCDKQSPCSNCRRAGVACTFPSSDRPPRWARRFERAKDVASNGPALHTDPDVDNVEDRIRNLEQVVQELRSQLELGHVGHRSETGSTSETGPAGVNNDNHRDAQRGSLLDNDASGVQKHFGRLVLQDAGQGRYVSNGFWSEVQDEVS
jgi:hypothetical protein